jgi:hypothetical protein
VGLTDIDADGMRGLCDCCHSCLSFPWPAIVSARATAWLGCSAVYRRSPSSLMSAR